MPSKSNPGTVIWVPIDTREKLKNARLTPSEPYYQVIDRLLKPKPGNRKK